MVLHFPSISLATCLVTTFLSQISWLSDWNILDLRWRTWAVLIFISLHLKHSSLKTHGEKIYFSGWKSCVYKSDCYNQFTNIWPTKRFVNKVSIIFIYFFYRVFHTCWCFFNSTNEIYLKLWLFFTAKWLLSSSALHPRKDQELRLPRVPLRVVKDRVQFPQKVYKTSHLNPDGLLSAIKTFVSRY